MRPRFLVGGFLLVLAGAGWQPLEAHDEGGEHVHPPRNFAKLSHNERLRYLLDAEQDLFHMPDAKWLEFVDLAPDIAQILRTSPSWQQRIQAAYLTAYTLSSQKLSEGMDKELRSALSHAENRDAHDSVRSAAARASALAPPLGMRTDEADKPGKPKRFWLWVVIAIPLLGVVGYVAGMMMNRANG